MSKILFLADLHGNMTATHALEKEMKKIAPDDVYFVGDCVIIKDRYNDSQFLEGRQPK